MDKKNRDTIIPFCLDFVSVEGWRLDTPERDATGERKKLGGSWEHVNPPRKHE